MITRVHNILLLYIENDEMKKKNCKYHVASREENTCGRTPPNQ